MARFGLTSRPKEAFGGEQGCVCVLGGGRKVKKFGDRVTCLSVVTRFISSV